MMIDDPKDQVMLLDPRDLEMLLATAFKDLPGMIMRLNRDPRYHNRLNAVGLTQHLEELRRQLIDPAG